MLTIDVVSTSNLQGHEMEEYGRFYGGIRGKVGEMRRSFGFASSEATYVSTCLFDHDPVLPRSDRHRYNLIII